LQGVHLLHEYQGVFVLLVIVVAVGGGGGGDGGDYSAVEDHVLTKHLFWTIAPF
jgi:hypothetical protein